MIRSAKGRIIVGSVVILAGLALLMTWEPSARRQPSVATGAPELAPLTLYCAAGIKPPVEKTARDFENQYGQAIRIEYGGSGALLSKLRIAREGDLFLAADSGYMEIARQQGLLAEVIPLAVVRPVIAVAKGNPKSIMSVKDLLRPEVKISLCNPDAASVGRQTRLALQKTGQWDDLETAARTRGVFKPTVTDAANDVKIGAVDAAIVWDATVAQYPELEIALPLTDDASFAMRVEIGVLTLCRRPAQALKFARYLAASDRGLREFAARGYTPVEGDPWEETPELRLLSGGVNRVAIEDTIRAFEAREGVRVTRVYNGCGILVAQMKAGERPDAYFACDTSFMSEVSDLFLDSTDLSQTDMVIAVPKGNPRKIATLRDLTADGLKVGLGHPTQGALGALTERLLRTHNLLDAVMKNVVSQTPTADLLVNQLRTESLDAVIVYRVNCSQVLDALDVIPIDVPGATAVQPFAIGRASTRKELTRRFLRALESADSRRRFQDVGFQWVGPSPEQP